jgi:hypothetical protein
MWFCMANLLALLVHCPLLTWAPLYSWDKFHPEGFQLINLALCYFGTLQFNLNFNAPVGPKTASKAHLLITSAARSCTC